MARSIFGTNASVQDGISKDWTGSEGNAELAESEIYERSVTCQAARTAAFAKSDTSP